MLSGHRKLWREGARKNGRSEDRGKQRGLGRESLKLQHSSNNISGQAKGESWSQSHMINKSCIFQEWACILPLLWVQWLGAVVGSMGIGQTQTWIQKDSCWGCQSTMCPK